MQKLMRWFTNQGSISFLALLISIDLAFIITHIVYENLAIVEYDNFSITKDRGYSEIFQYLKLGLIAICFGTLNFLRKRRIYAAWSLLSLIILLDDMFVLHEKVGKRLAIVLSLPSVFGLNSYHFGEFLVYIAYGAIFLAIAFASYRSKQDYATKKLTKTLIILFAIFAAFGGIVDTTHSLLNYFLESQKLAFLDIAFDVIEDGGELIVMSVVTWLLCQSVQRQH
jgi:hypothetical protein